MEADRALNRSVVLLSVTVPALVPAPAVVPVTAFVAVLLPAVVLVPAVVPVPAVLLPVAVAVPVPPGLLLRVAVPMSCPILVAKVRPAPFSPSRVRHVTGLWARPVIRYRSASGPYR